jgi:hypothetical protein
MPRMLPASVVFHERVCPDPVGETACLCLSVDCSPPCNILMAPRIPTVPLPQVTLVEMSPRLAAAKPENIENDGQPEVSNFLPC